jgi:hypothetical protein
MAPADKNLASRSFEGGCLCGAIRYRLTLVNATTDYCHCDMCRRWSGAPVSAWTQVPVEQFQVIKGNAASFRSSDIASRHFCRDCGSPLYMTDVAQRSVGIMLGTLDDANAVAPNGHGWASKQLSWLALSDHLPRWPENPPYDAD